MKEKIKTWIKNILAGIGCFLIIPNISNTLILIRLKGFFSQIQVGDPSALAALTIICFSWFLSYKSVMYFRNIYISKSS